MNVDQVIEGIGKAVAATKPAPEYCLFRVDHWSTCMTKSEWSGWMQAIGALAAICFALLLPFIQNKFRRARTYVVAKHGLAQLVATYESMEYVVNIGTFNATGALKASQSQLRSLMASLDLVRVDELPVAAYPTWWSGRSNAFQLSDLEKHAPTDEVLKQTLAGYKKIARQCLADFLDHEPRVFFIPASRIWG